jgi:phthalate 4,5-dioxygenase oxygenase subunit
MVKLASYQGVVPKTEDWRKLGASADEVAVLDGLEEDETERAMSQAV